MKVTVFIYDRSRNNIVSRKIDYKMLDEVLDEYDGKATQYMVATETEDFLTLKAVYDEFSNKIHRQLFSS